MTRSSADRLRKLRLRLTVLFIAINSVGLIVFAVLVVNTDREKRRVSSEAELREVTFAVSRAIGYTAENGLHTRRVEQDALNSQCPQFAVIAAGAGDFPAHFSSRQCAEANPAQLAGYVRDSVEAGKTVSGYFTGPDGGLVQFFVDPIRNEDGGSYIGAIIAWSDADGAQDAADLFALAIIGGSALLLVALGLVGHVVSGRAIRPAATALAQQEVLLAETAHDLRTPVAALRALAESAARNPEQSADLLPRTVRLAGRMGGIIDSLLVRARLAAGVDELAVQPVWLDQLVSVVVEETPTEGASVTLTAAPSQVVVDPSLVQRAVGNLLGNALRYGRGPDEKAVVHITVAGGRVIVADNGPGIDPAIADDLFDRFRTGSGSTGLGLSIVRWVAQAHGGSLKVYNAEEGGAIFELVLPSVR